MTTEQHRLQIVADRLQRDAPILDLDPQLADLAGGFTGLCIGHGDREVIVTWRYPYDGEQGYAVCLYGSDGEQLAETTAPGPRAAVLAILTQLAMR